MNLLLIDTSNQPMSIALMNDDEVLAIKTTNSKKDHSSQLMPGIQSLFNESNLKKQELDGIVVAKGPGSYTGVRIGVTVAKTLAYALNTKLYGVSSLKALAATIDTNDKRIIVPIFDARREAVYTGLYQYISLEALHKKLNALNQPYVFVGEDTEKLSELLHGDIETKLPNATVMKHLIHQPENIHTFVPNYIKLSEAERNWLNQQKNS